MGLLGQPVLRLEYLLYRAYVWIVHPLTIGVRVMMI